MSKRVTFATSEDRRFGCSLCMHGESWLCWDEERIRDNDDGLAFIKAKGPWQSASNALKVWMSSLD